MSYRGSVAFVTGAGSGIGKALALELARRGARVWVTDIQAEAAESVAAACGPTARALGLDVRDAEAVRNAIEGAALEGGRLDYVFNNAGMAVGGETHELTVAHFDRVLDVNVRGVVHGVLAAYPIMVRQGSGHIVNVASLAGLGPAPLLTAYATSKHAVVGLSTSLRVEGSALGVRVSALCPAAVETPILDSENPSDLPQISWKPNMRAFLTKLGGPPYPVDSLATEALDAITENVGVIVLPSRARFLWRLGRLLPALVEKASIDAVAAERVTKPKA
jgi:NAD(P)-dependent dehydrogenase (short-subunit alcohol dehydrogenase family)